MNILKGFITATVIIGGGIVIYKIVRKTNKVIDEVAEVKNMVTEDLTNYIRNMNKNLEEKIKKKEDNLRNKK